MTNKHRLGLLSFGGVLILLLVLSGLAVASLPQSVQAQATTTAGATTVAGTTAVADTTAAVTTVAGTTAALTTSAAITAGVATTVAGANSDPNAGGQGGVPGLPNTGVGGPTPDNDVGGLTLIALLLAVVLVLGGSMVAWRTRRRS